MAYNWVPYPNNNPWVYHNSPPRARQKHQLQFVWPRDGYRDHNSRGRLRDVLSFKGPDIFVSAGQRPVRSRWANRPWMDPTVTDYSTKPMIWADRKDKAFNFRTRKYEKERVGMDQFGNPFVSNPWTWTGAAWGPDGGKMPHWYRCGHGDFYQYL